MRLLGRGSEEDTAVSVALDLQLIHTFGTVVPHVYLDSPCAVGQLLHHIKIGSGMEVPMRCAILGNGPTDAIQSARECHCFIAADLIDGNIQFCHGYRGSAGGKPVFLDSSYP